MLAVGCNFLPGSSEEVEAPDAVDQATHQKLAVANEFTYDISIGRVRREIFKTLKREGITHCFEDQKNYVVTAIAGQVAYDSLASRFDSMTMSDYEDLLLADGSFAVRVTTATGQLVADFIPHPSETQLDSPGADVGFTHFPPIDEDDPKCPHSLNGETENGCKCNVLINDCSGSCGSCAGTHADLDYIIEFCPDTTPFEDDRPVYELDIPQDL